MSHFCLGVICRNGTEDEVDKLLKPFNVNCRDEFLKFHSITEEYKEEYEKSEHKEEYPTFDEYMQNYEHEERDEKTNDYGYWENPNGKWDWYEIGGCFSGIIPLKNGNKMTIAQIKDINFDRNNEIYKNEERFWELVVEEQPLREGEKEPVNWYTKDFYTSLYENKQEYADRESRFKTFALLTPDSVWRERGKMLWFGIDTRDKESNNAFEKAFMDVVEDPKYQEFHLVLVDCHI